MRRLEGWFKAQDLSASEGQNTGVPRSRRVLLQPAQGMAPSMASRAVLATRRSDHLRAGSVAVRRVAGHEGLRQVRYLTFSEQVNGLSLLQLDGLHSNCKGPSSVTNNVPSYRRLRPVEAVGPDPSNEGTQPIRRPD
jgi:hypothetical protein